MRWGLVFCATLLGCVDNPQPPLLPLPAPVSLPPTGVADASATVEIADALRGAHSGDASVMQAAPPDASDASGVHLCGAAPTRARPLYPCETVVQFTTREPRGFYDAVPTRPGERLRLVGILRAIGGSVYLEDPGEPEGGALVHTWAVNVPSLAGCYGALVEVVAEEDEHKYEGAGFDVGGWALRQARIVAVFAPDARIDCSSGSH